MSAWFLLIESLAVALIDTVRRSLDEHAGSKEKKKSLSTEPKIICTLNLLID